MNTNITLPTINLNGSNAVTLAEQYYEAAVAVDTAIQAMAGIVHGRDYQTAPVGAYEAAREEMHRRCVALDAIARDLHTIAYHCAAQS